MRWTAETTYPKRLTYAIEHDEFVGFYLYVYDGGRCIHDDLQDTLDFAKEVAFEKFSVPMNSWKETN